MRQDQEVQLPDLVSRVSSILIPDGWQASRNDNVGDRQSSSHGVRLSSAQSRSARVVARGPRLRCARVGSSLPAFGIGVIHGSGR